MEKEKVSPEEIDEAAREESAQGADDAAEQPSPPLEAGESDAAADAGADDPEARIAQLETEKAELYDQLLRQRAEFENARKRLERDSGEMRRFAEAGLVESLLPILDAFERAAASVKDAGQEEFSKGVELIYRQLVDTLTQAGLEPLESVGKVFDPICHHAIERVESAEFGDQEIVEELQRGYKFKDRLLRPALVKVAVHIEPEEAEKAGD